MTTITTEQLAQLIDVSLENGVFITRALEIATHLDNLGYEGLSNRVMDNWEDIHPETLEGSDDLERTLGSILDSIYNDYIEDARNA